MKYFNLIILFVFVCILSLNAQQGTETYTSIIVENGEFTGYTAEITLDWISTDTVEITKLITSTTQDDVQALYNLTNDPVNIVNGEASVYFDEQTWHIPFHDEQPEQIQIPRLYNIYCVCGYFGSYDGSCQVGESDTQYFCLPSIPCEGICFLKARRDQATGFTPGIFVNAKHVIINN